MGGSTPKQFLALAGLPILVHTLRALAASDLIRDIVLAVADADRDFCRREIVERHGVAKIAAIVTGGEERQDSVRAALEAADPAAGIILVHDAVRPFVTTDMIKRVIDAAAVHGAAIVALPMRDTVKHVGADGLIDRTLDRTPLWLAQTPQAFRRDLLADAHRQAVAKHYRVTDDAQLLEWAGGRVAVVEGSTENIKLTRPEDVAIGEAILRSRTS
jgi:2-C-methyl-D-erythritol 4-phosphate cytidylyltransferase